jgi:hypothetical protein
MIFDGAAIPYPKLLRHSNILNLCLYCHDGNQTGLSPPPPDVWGTLAAGQSNPSAGNLCSGGGATPCSDVSTNHSIGVDVSLIEPPGFVGTWSNVTDKFTTTFSCLYCHDQHGNANYRNLRADPGNLSGVTASYAMGAAGDATKHVNNILAAGPGVAKYETGVVVFRLAPTSNNEGIQGFCKGCHTNFHDRGGATEMGGSLAGDTGLNPWLRHPTMDVTMGEADTNLHVDFTNWQTALPWRPRIINADGTAGNADDEPFCLSCHRAHGSNRHSNLIYGEPTSTGGAGTMMRSTCQQCHNQ